MKPKRKKFSIEKDILFQKYTIENLSLKEITNYFSCSIKSIEYGIRKYNIHKLNYEKSNCENSKKIKLDIHLITEKYFKEKWSANKIAKFLDVSLPTIITTFRNYGYELRNASESKKGILNPMFGLHGSENPLHGRKRTPEQLEYIKSRLPKGSDNHNYKKPEDRIEPINSQIRNCQKSKDWKFFCLKRDEFTCTTCGSKENLEIDHIKSFSDIKKEFNITSLEEALICDAFWDINNGRTLCHTCHIKTESYGNKKIKNNIADVILDKTVEISICQ